ncbi:hypothetical protein CEP54_005303 [Fusarium duplospermum]|uniref:Heterokaryon incompatibility domain-containing protein n=1 Tax=Fusarium duplospermum TaxID=1325734 RepID=A0A428QDE8_9HYPO|nr:hypothetical protein CEP54_005303 [Fusarium duplospermum]
MAIVSNYSLSFLDGLPPGFDETNVKNIWSGRVFPLVLTNDFTANWVAISDPNGLFETPSGERCRVEPQPHHVDRLRLLAQEGSTQRVVYEAIVFAKVAYRLSLGQNRDELPQLARRRFVNLVATKFPIEWQELIIQRDIHEYDEKESSQRSPLEARVYSCLAHPKNIRLLTLLPSNRVSAPIECSLHEVDHLSNPRYEALSYVWGTSPSRRSILLNGGEFSIGVNLEAALRQLRLRDGQGRTLWTDAICINQGNPQEKAHQVAQMNSIYKNASGVVIWLGHESITSAEVFNDLDTNKEFLNNNKSLFLSLPLMMMRTFHSGGDCPVCRNPHPDELLDAASDKVDIPQRTLDTYARQLRSGVFDLPEVRDMSTRRTKGLEKILSRPWWKRVWVLQEAILAKKITLHCGQRQADWTNFQASLFLALSRANRQGVQHSGSLGNRLQDAMTQSGFVTSIQRTFIFFFLQRTSGYTQILPRLSLANLLSLTVEFEATDPRDRFFALLSLLPNESSERLALQPDYTVKTRRLYIRAARHFLETTNRLEVITVRSLLVDLLPGELTLPSWVPNWGARSGSFFNSWYNSVWINDFAPFQAMSLLHDAQNTKDLKESAALSQEEKLQLFNASLFNASPFSFTFSAWDEILGVRGQSVDIIEEVGPVWVPAHAMKELKVSDIEDEQLDLPDGIPMSAIQAWKFVVQAWKPVALVNQETTYPFTNQSRLEVFWRTILMDRYHLLPDKDPFHLKRISPVISSQNAAQMFGPWGIGCSFPPQTQHDEFLLVYYVHTEAAQMWHWKANLHCISLRLFRTKKGYIGLCPPRAQPGDEVAILFGAPVPIVLREFDEGYVVIGTSYVHGIMDGEIIQDLRDQGKGMDETDYKLFKLI